MATIRPFRGVLYDPARVPDVSRVAAPPYDVIDAGRQRMLHDRDPHNVIRLELGLEEAGDDETQNKYSRAAERLAEWLQAGILRRDPTPAVYVYAIDYRVPGQPEKCRTLRGFLSRVALEEFGTGRIFPHEDTRSSAKQDRLKLLEACRAHFSPIFSLFSDPQSAVLTLLEKSVDAGRPRLDFTDDEGCRQRLWTITDRAVLHELCAAMEPKPLFIADGHHRYETALTYRRSRRQTGTRSSPQSFDSVLMLISSLEDPGLTVLPTHRVLRAALPPMEEVRRRLQDTLTLEELPFGGSEPAARARLLQRLRARGGVDQLFGLARRDAASYWLLTVTSAHRHRLASARDRLDVSVLQELVLTTLLPSDAQRYGLYTKDEQEALDWVRSGTDGAQAAFLLNATKVDEVRAVAAAGDRMPHKSTYFFPKPLTGLVLNVFDESD